MQHQPELLGAKGLQRGGVPKDSQRTSSGNRAAFLLSSGFAAGRKGKYSKNPLSQVHPGASALLGICTGGSAE